MIWSKSKPDVEFQYGGRLGEFHGISSQSQLPHCRVLLPGEFNVMIPELCVTLQGAATWWIHCHDSRATCHIAGCSHLAKCHGRATLQGVIVPSAVLKIVFCHILFFWVFKCSLVFDEQRLSYRLRYTCFNHCGWIWNKYLAIYLTNNNNRIMCISSSGSPGIVF